MKPLRFGRRRKPLDLPDPSLFPEGSILIEGQVYPPGTHPLNTPINLTAPESVSIDEFADSVKRALDAEEFEEKLNDPVNHPAHYTDGKIEVSDFIADKDFNFFRGNAIKYISRAGKKDPSREQEDLEKAIWYLQREIHRMGGYEVKKNPLDGVTIMVPHWADQNQWIQDFEEAFFNVWHDGLDAQALADNISAEMKQEKLMVRNGNK